MNCDPLAPWYRWLEYIAFGGALQSRRVAFLSDVANARRALVLGDGDGRFLVRLLEQNRGVSVDYIDLSSRMLGLARHRAGTGRVVYHHADALTIQLPECEYDLICTHFFLDCLDDANAAALVARVSAATVPKSRWLISEFRQQTFWARAIVRALYVFFQLTTGLKTTTLPDYHPLLMRAGFHLQRSERAGFGLLVSELWARENSENPL